ncbi:MAG TPA: NUDIX hydrolase [Candidatus Saccharimonadales bacterium]|nr:NUDIX hydrolase [Candidatus Saccharimonadales bacterium]
MKKIVPHDAILVPDKATREFEGKIFDVYQWPQELFDGTSAVFERLKRPDTATVVPILGDKIIVLEDEQPSMGMKVTFPGGRVDETDQSILEAAKRETLEETGYEFKQWRLIGVLQPHPKIEWFIHSFIAWDGQKVAEPHLDAGEKITLRLEDFDAVKKMWTEGVGYMGESKRFFGHVTSIEELLALPEFKGQEVDR